MDMSDSPEARIAEARERLEATKAAVARARAGLADASTTARSKDRSVEVTVGPQGELKRVRFLDDKYRTMEAAQLAAAVLEAANKGRAAMARRVIDTFSGITLPSQDAEGVSYRPPDWQEIFGSALAGNRRGSNATPRKPRGGRPAATLHDEIVEDGRDE
jgi:DNA-binding protein YbaB